MPIDGPPPQAVQDSRGGDDSQTRETRLLQPQGVQTNLTAIMSWQRPGKAGSEENRMDGGGTRHSSTTALRGPPKARCHRSGSGTRP